MNTPDDKTLTRFLITCFSGMFEGVLQPLPANGPKNLRKWKHSEGPLTYLETVALGGMYCYQIDIRVMLGPEGEREQIWGMQISAKSDETNIRQTRIPPVELRAFLLRSRQHGFAGTLKQLETGERFCLFDIPSHTEPVTVAPPGRPGKLHYTEDIDNSLDFFGGGEEISFRPDGIGPWVSLFKAYFQGGRL